jgi:hypothetical protein
MPNITLFKAADYCLDAILEQPYRNSFLSMGVSNIYYYGSFEVAVLLGNRKRAIFSGLKLNRNATLCLSQEAYDD